MTSNAPYQRDFDGDGAELQEKVVQIRRVAKVVKGGRNLHFNAMVVVGDGRGRVGMGLGRGQAVPDAVRNGTEIAKKHLVSIPLNGSTVHHTVNAKFGASKVLIKPAKAGAGVIAGGAVRAVMEALGVRDVVAKALGSRNPINVVKATMTGLQMLQGEHNPLSDEVLQAERAAQRRRESNRPEPPSSRSNSRSSRRQEPAPPQAPVAVAAQELVVDAPDDAPEAEAVVETPAAEVTVASDEPSAEIEAPVGEAVDEPVAQAADADAEPETTPEVAEDIAAGVDETEDDEDEDDA